MLNLELRASNKDPIIRQLRFTPHIQIEVCISNFLKKLQETEKIEDEYSPENIMKYLYFNGKKINKEKFFEDYDFKNGDKIIVSNYDIHPPIKIFAPHPPVLITTDDYKEETPKRLKEDNSPTIIHRETHDNKFTDKKNNKKIWIIIGASILFGLIILIIFLWGIPKTIPSQDEEDFIVDIRYRVNETSFFINKRINNSTMIYNGKEENRKTEIFTNFTMTITKEYKIDNKLCYSGYLVILNMTTSNETDSNIEAGFDLFNSSSTKKNLRNLKSDDITIDLSNKDFNDIDISQYFDTSKMNESEVNDLINQFRSVPIIKFDFFKNGEIREILYPKNLKLSILYNMNDLIDKIIPKVNKKLYQDDYDTVFGNQTNVYDDSDEDEVEEESEEEEENGNASHERRRVRRLSNEIRTYRGIDNSSDNNSTNLIEINQAPVESDKIKLEGSTANSNIERKYNCNSNKIENINYSGEASLVNKLPNEEEQYNELLQEKTQSNILDVDLKQIDIKTNNSIEFIKNITDLKVISMLDEVFNKMEIVKYNQSEYTNTTLRILNSIPLKDVKVIKRNQNKIWKHVKLYKTKKIAKKHIEKLRNLSPDILKQKLEYAYNIFKTNIFGLKLQFQIIESFDMTNGKIDVQFILTIGCLDFVFPFKSFDSQINKIVNDSQLMTKKFMDILKESGKGITKLNKEYSPDLINYEKDLKDLIQNPYDFSNLYRKPYNDLYK